MLVGLSIDFFETEKNQVTRILFAENKDCRMRTRASNSLTANCYLLLV